MKESVREYIRSILSKARAMGVSDADILNGRLVQNSESPEGSVSVLDDLWGFVSVLSSQADFETSDAFLYTFKAYESWRNLSSRFIRPSEALMLMHRERFVS